MNMLFGNIIFTRGVWLCTLRLMVQVWTIYGIKLKFHKVFFTRCYKRINFRFASQDYGGFFLSLCVGTKKIEYQHKFRVMNFNRNTTNWVNQIGLSWGGLWLGYCSYSCIKMVNQKEAITVLMETIPFTHHIITNLKVKFGEVTRHQRTNILNSWDYILNIM